MGRVLFMARPLHHVFSPGQKQRRSRAIPARVSGFFFVLRNFLDRADATSEKSRCRRATTQTRKARAEPPANLTTELLLLHHICPLSVETSPDETVVVRPKGLPCA